MPLSRLAIECGQPAEQSWQLVAEHCRAWASEHGCALRDCIVLVPYAQLIAPARAAFVRQGGWMPRIETSRTLARSLGPEPAGVAHGPSLDAAFDSLAVHQLLQRQTWGRVWRARDPVGFSAGVAQVVRTGYELARAAFGCHPDARAAYWARVRLVLAPTDGPGARERRLARIAAEWAALAPEPATDRLFTLRPAGWMAIGTASRDSLVPNLLEAAAAQDVPSLMIDLQPGFQVSGLGVDAGTTALSMPSLQQSVCADFEQEAQVAAALVLRQLQHHVGPVVLVAQDRILVRRVRALLDRASVSISDETGWKLSTTRAAARVMTLLRAARPDASSDAWFDWVKTGVAWPDIPARELAPALRSLETTARRRRLARVRDLDTASPGPAARELLAHARATLNILAQLRDSTLGEWLVALGNALRSCGAYLLLSQDDAGRQVLRTLRLDADGLVADTALHAGDAMPFGEFVAWIDLAFESTSFLPRAGEGNEPAQVIITPMAQAVLRPFAAVVVPGADARRLGAPPAQHPLLSNGQLLELGLIGVEEARRAEQAAFLHLFSQAPVMVLRRLSDEGDPLGPSPLVEQMALRLRPFGGGVLTAPDPRERVSVPRHGTERSAPRAPSLVPRRLSASSFEALRDCPYRFFARAMLRLREPEEIERDLEKRDYGTWLHAVLNRFHTERAGAQPARVELGRLHALAEELEATLRLEPAEFLPFRASFRALAPRYVAWLHARDQQGWRWADGEFGVTLDLSDPAGVTLEGQIDRIDVAAAEGAETTQLIDYKTGGLDGLKRRVSDPLEDTQLAFYAALLRARAGRTPQAGYLALDSKRIEWVEHRDVERSATKLLAGLGSEVTRLRNGAALRALGEGETCTYCEMRGLCRRDDWAAGAANPK